jgi:hypothetical protein
MPTVLLMLQLCSNGGKWNADRKELRKVQDKEAKTEDLG